MVKLAGEPAVPPVRWGILSTARIARQRVAPAMLKSESTVIAAVASRSLDNARNFAGAFDIPKAYGSYQELFDDPEIDVIYNALPNNLHLETTLAALARGKHVLCEKPLGMSRAEAETLKAAAGPLLVAEAFMIRHHPQWHEVRRLLRAGRIGPVHTVQTFFSFLNIDPNNIRNKPETGGGAILDIGCYAIASARFIFEAEPVRVMALIDRDPVMGTDRSVSILADFGEGRQFSASLSTQAFRHQRVGIIGTEGRIEMPTPFSAPTDETTTIGIDIHGPGQPLDTLTIPAVDQYALQVEAFSRAVRGTGPWQYGIDDALANMAVLDALFRSEKSGTWERP
ncbi:Gfo/Idh/MocA family oxidoreductase [Kaistia dalseonensis]|uniref:Dehydrogenase n=1 Tax=Kaistia dalseonensis TaxID=410840 RepID=A0ABU0H7V3_9HYPH|nr:Gfo/Idh/MocA family oxidoreductase [Kaistia dalseonensis]MCX5494998.1 Gfo/Idh/MocA family oxidoreductase [Kaistia dalseonensis]MDQ0437579.1 putative dehydrogenase [Kaistia dalseonensis]